jgi:nucleotide-binding universal stress UspA family protein
MGAVFGRALVALELTAHERLLHARLAGLSRLGCRTLHLAHVGSYHLSRAAHARERNAAEYALATLADGLRAAGFEVSYGFRAGEPALELDRVMQEYGLGLLVAGLKPLPMLGQRTLGATMLDLARARDWPMLLLEAKSTDGGPLVLATDLSVSARGAERVASALLDGFVPPALAVSVFARRRLRRRGQEQSEGLLRQRFPAPDWQVAVRAGRPAVELSALAAECNASVLVIGRGHRSGLRALLPGCTVRQVCSRARCDVLLIP